MISVSVVYALSGIAAQSSMLMDAPNARSSHSRETSRGGGLAIGAGWIAAMFVLMFFSQSIGLKSDAFRFAWLAAVATCVGLADDRWTLSPLIKLLAQIGVGVLFVWQYGGLDYLPLPSVGMIELGPIGMVFGVLWIVAFLNAFNFMDGLNGIAASSAIAAMTPFALILAFSGDQSGAVLAIMLAISCFGFLPANMIRGRLFMGDAGSHLIAFIIAGLALRAVNGSEGQASFLLMPVIFAPFVVDVAFTLLHRLLRGKNVLNAHREHVYQLIQQMGFSHANVTLIYVSAIFLSAGIAMLMLTQTPEHHWQILIGYYIVLCAPAGLVYFFAKRRGLFDSPQTIAPSRQDDEQNPASEQPVSASA